MEGQLDLDKAMIAIGDMGLASVNVGDYLIILNKDIDLTVGDEPYISFILFYNKVSGRFFKRIWNKTVATGTTTDIATLVKVCGIYFNRGMTCLCFMKSDGQYELPQDVTSACHSFMTKIHGNDGKMCSECRKILETINDGVQEKEDIKSEDFEDKINEESSFEDGLHGQPPTETVFDYDSGANEVDVKEEEGFHNGDKEPLSQVERPNINYQDLIVEALEGGKTLSVKEIMKFISQKHTNIVLSVDRVRRCLTGTNLFERLSLTGDKMRGHWRLNTSKEGSKSDKCDYCDRRFPEGKKGNKFLWHMKAWHGKNSFHCPSCEFHANFAAEVFEHIELVQHQDETIECPMCHEFFNEADMTSHYRPCFAKTSRARIKEGNRISKPCPTCGKVINTKRGYKQHLMMHLRQEGERSSVAVPYSNGEKKNLWIYCDKCDKKFASIWMLNKHTQVRSQNFTKYSHVQINCYQRNNLKV